MTVIIEEHYLPINGVNRTGEKIEPEYITIHEVSLGTGKTPRKYDYNHYKQLLLTPPEGREFVGYHYLVGDDKILCFIPDNELCHHSSNRKAGIGIERLVNECVDFEKAINNQAKLTATLMYKYNIPLSHVVTHKFWSGKECPARLLDGQYGGWEGFLKRVETFYLQKNIFDAIINI